MTPSRNLCWSSCFYILSHLTVIVCITAYYPWNCFVLAHIAHSAILVVDPSMNGPHQRFLPLFFRLVLLVTRLVSFPSRCAFVMLQTVCKQHRPLLAYSEWHHRRGHVSHCWREEDPGWGVVSESQGQVSHHTSICWVQHSRTMFTVCDLFFCLHVCARLYRMDQVIVHVGCLSLKDTQELVSCCLYVACE